MPRHGLLIWRHTFYERLCAKVAYGDASDAEFSELIQHLQSCCGCRTLLRDFIRIVADVLPQIAEGYRTRPFGTKGDDKPFADNGAGQTLVKNKKKQRLFRWSLLLAFGAPAVLSVLLVASYLRLRMNDSSRTTQTVTANSMGEIEHNREHDLSNGTAGGGALQAALLQVSKLKIALKEADASSTSIGKKNSELEARLLNYEKTISENERIVQEKTVAVERLKQEIAEQDERLNSKATELATVKSRLAAIGEELDHQRSINSALSKAQELIAARDFHLISVPSMDPDTGHPRPFGRILYAEGKELMFYAFNLDGSAELASANFHVWGDKTGAAGSTRSLGVFNSDDKAAGRWRFVFSDANVLASLDRIFVTVELSTEAVTKPKGKKILIAYLGEKPNHP